MLAGLETNKSHGPDNIPPRILKVCAKELKPPLAKLINISLSSGNLPSEWKVTNVVPIHMSGDHALATNYRPVSSSIVVRTLKRLIHKHIMAFLIDQSLLCDNQHGFWKISLLPQAVAPITTTLVFNVGQTWNSRCYVSRLSKSVRQSLPPTSFFKT